VPLREIEHVLRARLAGTLPGIEAQIRFAPDLLQKAWRTGQFPITSRPAAALLLLWSRLLGASWRLALPVALAATLVIHLAFYKLLKVPLPWGIFERFAF